MRTRKEIWIICLMLIGVVEMSFAQISAGIKTGVNWTSVSVAGAGDFLPDAKSIDGFNIGAVAEIPVWENLYFQPEFNFARKGFKVKEGFDLNLFELPVPLGLEAHTRVKYVEVPLLAKYKMGNEKVGTYMLLGPYVGYATKATLQTKARVIIDFNVTQTDIDLNNDNFQRWDAGLVGGLGVWANIGNGQVFLDARYQQGFSNMFDDPVVDIRMKNKGIGLNAGFMYNF